MHRAQIASARRALELSLRAELTGGRPNVRSARPLRLPRNLGRSRLLTTSAIRYAQPPQPSSSAGRPPLQMPHDMPREDYAAPTIYTLSYLARLIRYLLYGLLSLGAISVTAFESLHLYIENISLAAPTRISSNEYGWEEESPSWTGGVKGGTDSRLGFRARHALRAAWICQEIGAGGGGSIGRSNLHPTMGAIAGRVNQIDRGYELAEEYIDLAIREAKRKGLRFPPNLPARRPSPSSLKANSIEADPTATDLLLLKAGVLERLSTDTSLRQAKDIYEQVLFTPGTEARRMRLATKIGDLEQRTGGDGSAWWEWSLSRAGLATPSFTPVPVAVVAEKAKGWFGRSAAPTPPVEAPSMTSSSNHATLSAPVLRAAITAVVSSEAQLAKSGHFTRAAAYQDLALSLLTRQPATATPTSDSAELHDLWLAHRAALIQLHKTSITHAQGQPSFELAQATTTAAEAALSAIPDPPSASRALSFATKLLSRDAHLLAAEANYIKGVLLEKQGVTETLEPALESFERAMSLSSADGEDVKGEEWSRYWRSYARVRDKMDKLLEK